MCDTLVVCSSRMFLFVHDLLSLLSSYSALRGLGSWWAIIYFHHTGSKSETLSSKARLTFAVILKTWQSVIEGNHFTEPLLFFLTWSPQIFVGLDTLDCGIGFSAFLAGRVKFTHLQLLVFLSSLFFGGGVVKDQTQIFTLLLGFQELPMTSVFLALGDLSIAIKVTCMYIELYYLEQKWETKS